MRKQGFGRNLVGKEVEDIGYGQEMFEVDHRERL